MSDRQSVADADLHIQAVSVATKGLSYYVPAKSKTQRLLPLFFSESLPEKSPTGRPVSKKENKVEILKNVDFIAKPGEFVCILGPSGSGKTTLLNLIGSRAATGTATGEIYFNGAKVSKKQTQRLLSLVMASDRHMPYLTLEETLQYGAKFKLPFSTSAQRQARVESVMEELGLFSIRDHRVGGVWRKGLSSGELRRLSIGIELLNNPAVLLLDEPTSGLDAALAFEIVCCLKQLSLAGRTVICTLHQPRSSVYALFDRLCLMTAGQILYQGPADFAGQYFESLGYFFPPNANASDVLLDIASQSIGESTEAEESPMEGSTSRVEERGMHVEEMLTYYDASAEHQTTLLAIETECNANSEATRNAFGEAAAAMFDPMEYSPTRFVKETWGISGRTFWNSFRNPLACGVIILVQALMGLFIGAVLFDEPGTFYPDTTPPMVSANDSALNIWLSSDVFTILEQGVDRNGTRPLLSAMTDGVDGNNSHPLDYLTSNTTLLDMFHGFVHCLYDDMSLAKYYPEADYGYLSPIWEKYYTDNNYSIETPTQSPDGSTAKDFGPMYPSHVSSDIAKLLQILDFTAGKFDWAGIHHQCLNDPGISDIYYMCLMCYPDTHVLLNRLTVCMDWMPIPSLANAVVAAMCPYADLPDKQDGQKRLLSDRKRLLGSDASSADHNASKAPSLVSRIDSFVASKLHSKHSRGVRSSGVSSSSTGGESIVQTTCSGFTCDMLGPTGVALIESLGNISTAITECDHDFCKDLKAESEDPNSTTTQALSQLSDYGMVLGCVMNLAGCLFFAAASVGFASYDALIAFPQEKALFNRDTANGLYLPSSYFIGKNLADLFFQVVPSLGLVTIFYFMTGLNQYQEAFKYFRYAGICALLCWSAYGFAYMCSALAPKMEVGVVFAPMVLVVLLACGGFFIRDDAVPNWATWVKWISYYRWGFFGLMVSQFPPDEYYGGISNEFTLDIAGVTELRCWVNCLALITLAIGFRALAFVFLKYLHRSVGIES